jgi:hypothetical protein
VSRSEAEAIAQLRAQHGEKLGDVLGLLYDLSKHYSPLQMQLTLQDLLEMGVVPKHPGCGDEPSERQPINATAQYAPLVRQVVNFVDKILKPSTTRDPQIRVLSDAITDHAELDTLKAECSRLSVSADASASSQLAAVRKKIEDVSTVFGWLLKLVFVLDEKAKSGRRVETASMKPVIATLMQLMQVLGKREKMLNFNHNGTTYSQLRALEAKILFLHAHFEHERVVLQSKIDAATAEVEHLMQEKMQVMQEQIWDLNATIANQTQQTLHMQSLLAKPNAYQPNRRAEIKLLKKLSWSESLISVLTLLQEFAIAVYSERAPGFLAAAASASPFCQEKDLKYPDIIKNYYCLVLGEISYTDLIAVILELNHTDDAALQSLQGSLRKITEDPSYAPIAAPELTPFESADAPNVKSYFKMACCMANQLRDGRTESLLIPFEKRSRADKVFMEMLSKRNLELVDGRPQVVTAAHQFN